MSINFNALAASSPADLIADESAENELRGIIDKAGLSPTVVGSPSPSYSFAWRATSLPSSSASPGSPLAEDPLHRVTQGVKHAFKSFRADTPLHQMTADDLIANRELPSFTSYISPANPLPTTSPVSLESIDGDFQLIQFLSRKKVDPNLTIDIMNQVLKNGSNTEDLERLFNSYYRHPGTPVPHPTLDPLFESFTQCVLHKMEEADRILGKALTPKRERALIRKTAEEVRDHFFLRSQIPSASEEISLESQLQNKARIDGYLAYRNGLSLQERIPLDRYLHNRTPAVPASAASFHVIQYLEAQKKMSFKEASLLKLKAEEQSPDDSRKTFKQIDKMAASESAAEPWSAEFETYYRENESAIEQDLDVQDAINDLVGRVEEPYLAADKALSDIFVNVSKGIDSFQT